MKRLIKSILLVLFFCQFAAVAAKSLGQRSIQDEGRFVKIGETHFRGVHQALRLQDGRVLFMGYTDVPGARVRYISEVYDTKTKQLTVVHAGSEYANPFLRDDGKVLLFGHNIWLYDPILDKFEIINDKPYASISPVDNYTKPIQIPGIGIYFYGSSMRHLGLVDYFYNPDDKTISYMHAPESIGFLLNDIPQIIPIQDGFIRTGFTEGNRMVVLYDYKANQKSDYFTAISNIHGFEVELAPLPQKSPVVALDKEHLLYGDFMSTRNVNGKWAYHLLASKHKFIDYSNYTYLPDGNVLFLGGRAKNASSCLDNLSQNTEVYLVKQHRFIDGPKMSRALRDFQVTDLKDGHILLSGGFKENCEFPYLMPSSDLYLYKY